MDLNTHGLSYFFTDLCEEQKKTGLLEILRDFKKANHSMEQFDLNSVIVKVSENFDFIASKKIFKEKTWELTEDTNTIRTFIGRFIQQLANTQYDFIIGDTQAGPAAATREFCRRSGKAVIVSEPDPISVAASRSLDYEMHEDLPEFTRFLVNKLEADEVRSFRAIKDYLTIFEHVSPLPFDFEVRKAFSVRNIPIDPGNPSPFLFGTIELTKQIIPMSSKRMAKLEAELNRIVFSTVREKRDEYDMLIEEISHRMQELRIEQERYEAATRRRMAVMLSGIVIAATIGLVSYLIYVSTLSTATITAITAAAVTAALFPILLERIRAYMKHRRTELEIKIEELRERLADLKREKDRYDAMLLEKQERFMTDLE